MTKVGKTFGFLIVLSTMVSCSKSDKSSVLPTVSGNMSEVLVIINNQSWSNGLDTVIHQIFKKPYLVLNQAEPMFKVIHTDQANMLPGMKTHRNLVFVDISDEFDKGKFMFKSDVYAKDQIVIKLVANNDEQMKTILTKHQNQILDLVNEKERQRLLGINARIFEASVRERVKRQFNVDITPAKGFKIDTINSEFAWITQETEYYYMGIFVYQYPYNDTNTFKINNLINKRNEVLMKNVHGRAEGSFMGTETQVVPQLKEIIYNKKYYAEVRGLWKMEYGDYMGGPFMSLSTVNDSNTTVTTVEGYVYAPNREKINYMRTLEGILYSLKTLN